MNRHQVPAHETRTDLILLRDGESQERWGIEVQLAYVFMVAKKHRADSVAGGAHAFG